MRRIIPVALVVTAMLMTPLTAQAGWRHRECRYQGANGRMGFTRHEVKRTIRCAADKFNVSTSTALYVADRESNFLDGVVNSSSGAAGVYQHIPRYFMGRLHAVPNRYKPLAPNIFNGRSNVLAGLWLARVAGWGPWSTV